MVGSIQEKGRQKMSPLLFFAHPLVQRFLDQAKIIMFGLLFAWISFAPLPLHQQFQVQVRIFYVIFFLILILNQKYTKTLVTRSDWPMWVFVVSMSVGVVNALNKQAAWDMYMYLATTCFFCFYIGKAIFVYGDYRKIFGYTFSICVFFVLLLAVVELITKQNFIYEHFIENPFYRRFIALFPRPMSTQFHPTVLGSYLIAVLPFILYLAKKSKLQNKYFFLGVLSLGAAVAVSTFSRGVFLSLVVGVYIWGITSRKEKWIAVFGLGVVVIVIFASLDPLPNLQRLSFRKLFWGANDSVFSDYRFDRIRMAWHMLKDHPFVGVGLENFRLKFASYWVGSRYLSIPYEFQIPDNMYLSVISEIGLIGFIGWLFLLVSTLVKSFHIFSNYMGTQDATIRYCASLSFCCLVFHMASYDMFFWNNPFMLLCLAAGMIAARKSLP